MESPNRGRALLAAVMAVALSVWLVVGQNRSHEPGLLAEHLDAPPPVQDRGSQPAHQSAALEVLGQTPSVLGE